MTNDFWAKPYIMTLANIGILSGYPSGNFGPSDQVTIGQVLKVIDLTFNFYDYNKTYPYSLSNHWTNEHFQSLVAAGIILSEDDFYYPYTPDVPATRLQCEELLSQAIKILK